MGWKNVKEHYRIKHFVHIRDGHLCIGSPYAPDIVVVTPEGVLIKRCIHGITEDIRRYQDEIDADAETFRRLMHTPDLFPVSMKVYTYADGRVIVQECDNPGWPNVTHDGQLMYENTHFTDKAKCVASAISDYAAGVSLTQRDILDTQAKLESLRQDLARYEEYIDALKREYPTTVDADCR
jgi:hypothetical protein